MDNAEKETFNTISGAPAIKSIYPTPKNQIDIQNENPQKQKNWWKTLKALCLIILGLALFILIPVLTIRYLTDEYYNGSIATGPAIIDYQKYLENKYGKNENFYYVETNGNDCPIFEAGFCIRKFSTEALNGKTFDVRYQKSANSDYSDQYWLIRYDSQLDTYYRGFFDNIISHDYSLEFRGTLNDQNVSNMSFEELLSSDSLSVDIKILTTYENVPDISNIDFETLKTKISDIAPTSKLKRVDLIIDMRSSNVTGYCPNMATTGGGSSGEEIMECTKTLYSASSSKR